MKSTKKVILLALVFATVLTAAAGAASNEKHYTFGYTYWAASDFFLTIADSIKKTAESNGDKVIIVDAQQNNQTQLNIIDDFIVKGCDLVFLNPVDRDGIKPGLLALKKAGIPVVNFDTSVADLSLVNSYVASDNVYAGKICADAMNKRFPKGGEIAILDYPANSACLDRVSGFMKALNKNFKVVAQFDAQGKPGPGLEKATDILVAHPNLVAMFCVNDQCGMGAYGAISAAKANVALYGVDGSPEGKQAVAAKGQFVATSAQSPVQIGAKCIEIAYEILAGKKYEKEFYVPTFLIDASNVSKYLQGWQ